MARWYDIFFKSQEKSPENEEQRGTLRVDERWYIPYVNKQFFEKSGQVQIDHRNAMTLTSVWACVRIIMESIAMMDRKIVKKNPDGSYTEVHDHPLLPNINLRPNVLYSSSSLTQSELQDVCLVGNSFTHLSFDDRGVVSQQTKIPWDDVEKAEVTDSGQLLWHTTYGVFPDEIIKHYKIVPRDGIWGMSPVSWHRDTMTTIAETEAYGKEFFNQGAFPSGILSLQGSLKSDKREMLRSEVKKMKPGELMILDGGAEFKKIGSLPEDAAWLSTLDNMDQRIGAIFRVPTYMFSDTEKPGYNSLEQLALDFKQYTVKPYARMMEQEETYKMLSTRDVAEGYRVVFDYNTLDVTSVESLGEFLRNLYTMGILTINEIRAEFFNKEPVENGDKPLVQGNNMTTLDNAVQNQGTIKSTFEQSEEE